MEVALPLRAAAAPVHDLTLAWRRGSLWRGFALTLLLSAATALTGRAAQDFAAQGLALNPQGAGLYEITPRAGITLAANATNPVPLDFEVLVNGVARFNGRGVNTVTPWVPCENMENGTGGCAMVVNGQLKPGTCQGTAPGCGCTVTFRVENYLTMEPRRITLVPTLVYSNSAPEPVVIQPSELFLGGGDCPAEVNAQIIRPANAPPGWRQTANIEAFLDTPGGPVSLGSVAIEAGDRGHEVRIDSMDRAQNTLTLMWDGGGTLQQASRVTGPWLSLPGAVAPFTVAMTGTQRYFRVFETNWCSLTLVQQPRHTIAAPGGPVTFAVEAWALEGPFTYQWQEDRGTSLGWQDIPGATSATHTLPVVGPVDDGTMFRVLVGNGCTNTVSAAARLTVGCEAAPPGN